MSLQWKIDECAAYFDRLKLRGWCWHTDQPIAQLEVTFAATGTIVPVRSFGQPSPDVAAALDARASHCRFDEWIAAPEEALGRDFTLRITLEDGAVIETASALDNARAGDPFFSAFERFRSQLATRPGGRVLEIGSRARSAITRRDWLPGHLEYVGLDLLPGPNVDVVGDAHELSRLFERESFAGIVSFSVFEHLAMPWKVALEMNHVLAPSALVFTQTHHTWVVHEEPWDFWRFSAYSWQPLFNAATGFEVVEAVCGDPARIHPCCATPATRVLQGTTAAFLGSASIVRKISSTSLTWPVPTRIAAAGAYPPGELTAPPA